MNYRSHSIITAALITFSFMHSTDSSAATYIKTTKNPFVTKNGDTQYVVVLDPLELSKHEIDAKNQGYIRRPLSDLEIKSDNEEVEDPVVRYLAHKFSSAIGKSPVKIRSWVSTEFFIEAKPSEIKGLLNRKEIKSISEVDASIYENKFAASQAMGDIYSGNEIIPWWKVYTNTNDYISTNNHISVVDMPIVAPISSDLTFGIVDNSWDQPYWSGRSDFFGFWHATHVAGVIGAANNNFLIRGINPSQILLHYGGGFSESGMIDRFNLISARSELTRDWHVVNLSMNYEPNDRAPFEFSEDLGRAMAITSNSNLIVQSAGNQGQDACSHAFSFNGSSRLLDGIMVSGGIDIKGAPSGLDDSIYFNNTTPPTNEPVGATNYGKCVDI